MATAIVLVMFATRKLGMVVMSGDWEKDVRAIVSVMHEIGVGGLNSRSSWTMRALCSLW